MILLEIELSGAQKLLTVKLYGELDHLKSNEVRERVEAELGRTGAINIAFDFSSVTFMDSSGIGLLLGRYKTVNSLGGKLILFGMPREIERIMRMSGIDKIAEMY